MNNLINKNINGDCIEIIKQINDNSIDLVITDPPYNLGKDFGNDSDKQNVEDYNKWCLIWLNELYRVLNQNKKCFITYSQLGMFNFYNLVKQTQFKFTHLIIWHYGNIVWSGTQRLYVTNYEPIFILSKGNPEKLHRIVGVSTIDVWKYTKPQSNFVKDRLYHPTQKPIELFKRIIQENTKEQDLVLDIFSGVGTTSIACKRTNRNYIGIELNNKYVEIANKRLENEPINP